MKLAVLKKYRNDHGLTQQGLADQIGVKRETVARWEGGHRRIDQAKLDEVAKTTGLPRRELRPDLADLVTEEAAQ